MPQSSSHPIESTTLYTHEARPQWGLAILAWEGRDKRRYQFQDGQLRTFKKGYYEKLTPVAEPEGRGSEIVRDLKTMLRASRHHRVEAASAASASRTDEVRVDDQVEYFRKLYPQAFSDTKYRKDVRGEGAGRRKKRHRDAAIADARERLSADAIDARIAAGDFVAVRDTLVDVLKKTDLVTARDTKVLEAVADADAEALARAVRDLLHGASEHGERFARWVSTLEKLSGERPSWPLATAPAALVHPEEHVCVRPTVFRRQAKRLDPGLRYQARPSARLYERFLAVSSVLKTRLEQAGLTPRDMLDVYELVWSTLRRKALDSMK